MSIFKRPRSDSTGTKSVVGLSSIWSPPTFSLRQYGLIVAGLLVFAAGILLFAATTSPYASLTADTGTLTSGATKQACAGSSDGSCVVFGGSMSSSVILGADTIGGWGQG